MGVTSALVFANLGAAYGTAKSGVGIASMGVSWMSSSCRHFNVFFFLYANIGGAISAELYQLNESYEATTSNADDVFSMYFPAN